MTRVILKKLVRLGRDEDGAALIVTLALFMFMYLSCAGVFAIGQQVKNRIHLQNACDAAAYSAAVVQADTLSRIATINRAMAWTYVSMTRRQMDYIVDRWLEHAVSHFNQDKAAALAWYLASIPPPPCPIHASWGMGADESSLRIFGVGAEIDLNEGSDSVTPLEVKSACSDFKSTHFNGNRDSFYSRLANASQLAFQIDDDKDTITEMNLKIRYLSRQIPERVKTVVQKVLLANIMTGKQGDFFWFIKQNENPADGAESASGNGYLRDLHNTDQDERRFLEFGDFSGGARSVFKQGIDVWFEYADKARLTLGEVGLQRSYRQYFFKPSGKLVAKWTWWSTRSVGCEFIPDVGWVHGGSDTLKVCPHPGIDDRCHHTKEIPGLPPRYLMESEAHGNSFCVWDERYEGSKARPLVLRDEYFGEKGTITVGLACYNENPWYWIFKKSAGIGKGILDGIYGAFNPYKHVEWTWAFSSAKAGYKNKGEGLSGRDYMIHWDEYKQDWNLCQSDWDAVFVPVRRAGSKAKDHAWADSETAPLGDWVEKGDWNRLVGSGSSYAVHEMPDLPGMHDSDASGGLNWNRLADMLYH